METPVAVAEVIFDKKNTELSSEEDLKFYCAKGMYLIIKVDRPPIFPDCQREGSCLVYTPLDIQDSSKYSHLPHIKCVPRSDWGEIPYITSLDKENGTEYDYILPSKKTETYMRIKRGYLESKKGK
jgi:hypothetical protein